MDCEIVILGAGLAGLVSAIRLNQLGKDCILVDVSLPSAEGKLGGFAKFSGAKFSLPPAGLGLLNVVEDENELWNSIDSVAKLLELDFSIGKPSKESISNKEYLRSYDSLVLKPIEIDNLIIRLSQKLTHQSVPLYKAKCNKITLNTDRVVLNINENGKELHLEANTLFYAGGRLGEDLLLDTGVPTTNTKGIDVGLRVEFSEPNGLKELRNHGPDAKIIRGNCRTFCLNVPGKIFRYPYNSISIPGGVVATDNLKTSNVGILYRSDEKNELLDRIHRITKNLNIDELEKAYKATGNMIGEAKSLIEQMYGKQIASSLMEFGEFLSAENLVDWNCEHYVHIPLIDWHWNTFSLESSFRTHIDKIYCIGDSSGHARGLLQAALSGWIAAEEYSSAD